MTRPIPDPVATAWRRTTTEAPLAAVAASRELHHGLGQWQVDLVREALASGASWEDVGEALGTTRQAAWARFRHAMDEGGSSMDQQSRRQRLSDVKRSGIAKLRQVEEQWKTEREALRDEMVATQRKLKEAQRLHVQRQKQAREELKRAITLAARELKAG
jgi:hypothetical protein